VDFCEGTRKCYWIGKDAAKKKDFTLIFVFTGYDSKLGYSGAKKPARVLLYMSSTKYAYS